MSNTYTFVVSDDGKLPIGIKETLANVIPTFKGRRVRLTLGDAAEKRSLGQNAYYWTVIVMHVRQVRYDNGDALSADAVHEDLLAEFAPSMMGKKLNGESYPRALRSSEMNKEQMTNYITAITARMAEFGNAVPIREDEYYA